MPGGAKTWQPEPVDESTPFKGKPSQFFFMQQNMFIANEFNPNGYELNPDQYSFIYLYYP